MSDPFISMVNITGFNWAPADYALCNGALMNINEHTSLFALIGTAFGGNGQTTFGIPDLRGRTPVGTGVWDVTYTRGLIGGENDVVLAPNNLPPHTHKVEAMPYAGTQKNVTGNTYAETSPFYLSYTNSTSQNVSFNPAALPTSAGSNASHTNIQPYTALNFIIAISGTFPQRN
jgi:microcystin-dependent protein